MDFGKFLEQETDVGRKDVALIVFGCKCTNNVSNDLWPFLCNMTILQLYLVFLSQMMRVVLHFQKHDREKNHQHMRRFFVYTFQSDKIRNDRTALWNIIFDRHIAIPEIKFETNARECSPTKQ